MKAIIETTRNGYIIEFLNHDDKYIAKTKEELLEIISNGTDDYTKLKPR